MSKKKKNRERRVVSARDRVERHKSGFEMTSLNLPEGVKLFKVDSEDVRRIDIIPYEVGKGNPYKDEGELYFERTYYTHRGIGPNKNTYICPAKTFGKKCPVCEDIPRLKKEGDLSEDEIKALRPKERQLFCLIDLNDKKAGVQVWDIAFPLFGKALDHKVKKGDDGEYDNFADLEGGKTLKISPSKESGGGHTYFDCSDIEFKDRKSDYDEDILEKAPCLDEMIKEISYKELKKIYEQGIALGPDEDEDDEEEDKKKKKKKKKAKGKKKPDDDEDEEEDDEDEDEEEDDDDEDDDDEDDDDEEDDDEDEDEEEDDEEGPKGKKKGKQKPPPKGKGPAHKMGLKVGMTLEHEDLGTVKLMHISGDGTSLRVEDEEGELHRAIDPEECEIVEEDEDDKKKKGKKKPAPAKSKSKGKKKPEDDEDEDDEDEDDDEDEEDEDDEDEDDEPKGKKKKKAPVKSKSKSKSKGKKKPKDDDEDDDEDDDD